MNLVVRLEAGEHGGGFAGGGEIAAAGGLHRGDVFGVGDEGFERERFLGGDALEEEPEGVGQGQAQGRQPARLCCRRVVGVHIERSSSVLQPWRMTICPGCPAPQDIMPNTFRKSLLRLIG